MVDAHGPVVEAEVHVSDFVALLVPDVAVGLERGHGIDRQRYLGNLCQPVPQNIRCGQLEVLPPGTADTFEMGYPYAAIRGRAADGAMALSNDFPRSAYQTALLMGRPDPAGP